MNNKNLVKIIERELSILTDFVNGFADSENIHPMEVDLALSKAHDIYNELLLLKGNEQVPESVISVLEKVTKAVVESKTVEKGAVQEESKVVEMEPIIQDAIQEESVVDSKIVGKRAVQEDSKVVEMESNIQDAIQKDSTDNEKIALDAEEAPKVADAPLEIIPETLVELQKDEIITPVSDQSESAELKNPTIETPKIKEDFVESKNKPKLPEGIAEIKPIKTPHKAVNKGEKIQGDIIADKFSKDTLSINDMLAGFKNNNDIASILKGSPIADLKKAIKLNDRIWFTNELFNRNSATFENAVDVVNKSADLDSALKYLFANFTWNQEWKSTISFLELVFRRFPSN